MTPLQKARMEYRPQLPKSLENIDTLKTRDGEKLTSSFKDVLHKQFPKIHDQAILNFVQGNSKDHKPLTVGVVLSGGQAAGGHNVISGLFDALKTLNSGSRLIGFCDGPSGIVNNKTIEITESFLAGYRNQGGFDIIGSGRTKIETTEQFQSAENTVKALMLDGLVIIGGDDSNTNAAFLSEHFKSRGVPCNVIGVPKTIDGDLKNDFIEISFGFDTACKTYSEIIGNILRDALSAKKYYYFIKLMGRSASHITMECAFQVHPNLSLIGEEIEKDHKTLSDVVNEIADLICARSEHGKDYGAILIPEGIVEFIPEVKLLISELNTLLSPDRQHAAKIESFSTKEEGVDYIMKFLSTPSVQCFKTFPKEIQSQLMLDRDPHGNVQVSKIETERLFIEMVRRELNYRKEAELYAGKFSAQPLFCGYEGRSCLPSNFDSQYCYALGHVAALLLDGNKTGYMSCVQKLARPVEEWQIAGIPLVAMMHVEQRHGKDKAVIKKALVELGGRPFKEFKKVREGWMLKDDYLSPGPIQFYGPKEISDAVVYTLQYEQH